MRIFVSVAAAALAACIGAATALAQEPTPAGLWEAEDGRTRYTVALCGDGQQLCGYLSWIRPDSLDDSNSKYVGRAVFEEMPQAGRYRWNGDVTLEGYTVRGSVQLVASDQLKIGACIYIFICRSTMLTRVDEGG
ncbi:MAG: DUF2147 domain-containing protein [Cucumibacter sp.]